MNAGGSTTRRQVIGGFGAVTMTALPFASAARAQDSVPATPDGEDRMKVVLHVGESGGWAPALSNLDNMTSLHPDGEYRLVSDGTGVYFLAGPSDLTPRLEALAGKGVKIQVCPNALKEHGIAPSQLPSVIDTTVPGVVALVQAAQDGLVYVKP
jgi:intracellular sulfur oxidation DsrE/DsrF family protein